jgi:hypothetical protein
MLALDHDSLRWLHLAAWRAHPDTFWGTAVTRKFD